jgi:hypothetical protein
MAMETSYCFVEKQSKKQEYLDSGGKVGLEGESGSNSRKKDEAVLNQ